LFNQLNRGLSNFFKKITIKEFSPKSFRKLTIKLNDILVQNDVAVKTAKAICKKLEEKLIHTEHARFFSLKPLIISNLRDVLLEVMTPPENIDILRLAEEKKSKNKPLVIMFIGINGVGKTLTIGKIGKYLHDHNHSSVFAASDTFRAGSIQQLQKHGEKLGIRVIAQEYGSDAAAVAFDAINHAESKKIDVVLIDTAGRIETNVNLMAELEKLKRVAEPDLIVFVGDALTGNSLVSQATLFHEKIGIDASILNKMDADVSGGAAVSITNITKKPILFIGTGQKYKDIQSFHPEKIIDQILSKK
jgi:fused signal recognition particle receptor